MISGKICLPLLEEGKFFPIICAQKDRSFFVFRFIEEKSLYFRKIKVEKNKRNFQEFGALIAPINEE
jgi:hypothetical protein